MLENAPGVSQSEMVPSKGTRESRAAACISGMQCSDPGPSGTPSDPAYLIIMKFDSFHGGAGSYPRTDALPSQVMLKEEILELDVEARRGKESTNICV